MWQGRDLRQAWAQISFSQHIWSNTVKVLKVRELGNESYGHNTGGPNQKKLSMHTDKTRQLLYMGQLEGGVGGKTDYKEV